MAGKQTKKVLRAWKRFMRSMTGKTRGGAPTHRQSPLPDDIALPRATPQLMRQPGMIQPHPQLVDNNNNELVPRQRLNFGQAPRHHRHRHHTLRSPHHASLTHKKTHKNKHHRH